MKINQNLLSMADKDPTKMTNPHSITQLNERIEQGRLVLPLYQRDLSWTKDKYVSLLNYELLGYAPVSAISANVINNPERAVPQVRFVDRELIPASEIKSGTISIVDGQQRLTTNYMAYTDNKEFQDIVLDLGRGMFIVRDLNKPLTNKQIPVGTLLYKDINKLYKFIQSSPSLAKPSVQSLLLQIRAKFNNYIYTMNYAEDLDEELQVNWFEVLNNAGSRVTTLQMKFSKMKINGVDIYKDYTQKYVSIVENHQLETLFAKQETRVSYPICALNPAYEVIMNSKIHTGNFAPIAPDTKENQICNLNKEQANQCFEMTLAALERTLEFIDEYNLSRPDRIDYINFLLGYFIFNEEELDDETRNDIIHWYKIVDFSNTNNSQRRDMYSKVIYKKFREALGNSRKAW